MHDPVNDPVDLQRQVSLVGHEAVAPRVLARQSFALQGRRAPVQFGSGTIGRGIVLRVGGGLGLMQEGRLGVRCTLFVRAESRLLYAWG
jgi:hypothetical protein